MNGTVELRARLEARRDELAERVRRIGADLHHREEPMSADFAEQVVEQENLDVLHSLEAEGKAELTRVERALARLERGEYSRCSRCGEEIQPARLAALPYTDTCIHCAR
jgi:RNA polymerase-binding transcription factor DksA